ncbi:MAG: leucine-rich repeat protein [Clostridia bacterium]|nr:leucine-rich repeat protein [Clostridia bacterium]
MRKIVNETGFTITRFTNKDVIKMRNNPDFWNGITQIGADSFRSNKVESIIIPEGIEVIGARAFTNCRNSIRKVSIPSTVRRIDDEAFFKCKNIEEIFMPMPGRKVSIAASAFADSSVEGVIDEIFIKSIMGINFGAIAMSVFAQGVFINSFSSKNPDFIPF